MKSAIAFFNHSSGLSKALEPKPSKKLNPKSQQSKWTLMYLKYTFFEESIIFKF
jgi:hypothetical protein